MSERIDVLAVMDETAQTIGKLGAKGAAYAADLIEARAAVAEALEVLREFVADSEAHGYSADEYPLVARGRAALARIAPNELHDKAAELRGRGE